MATLLFISILLLSWNSCSSSHLSPFSPNIQLLLLLLLLLMDPMIDQVEMWLRGEERKVPLRTYTLLAITTVIIKRGVEHVDEKQSYDPV